jgi:hypothetical protein
MFNSKVTYWRIINLISKVVSENQLVSEYMEKVRTLNLSSKGFTGFHGYKLQWTKKKLL